LLSPRAELVIEGRIATLAGDEGFGWAEALAIGEGRVLAAGRRSEVEALAGAATRWWRLGAELMVMPGITDAHLHLLTMVVADGQVDLSATADLEATLDALAAADRERRERGDIDGWLLGHGWSLDRLGRWPDADVLGSACPSRPVALYAHDHHSRWLSHAALRLAGIDALADPSGGLIRRDTRGRATGILHETAVALVDRAIPTPTDDELAGALDRQAAGLAGLGVTGVHDPGELTQDRGIARGPVFYRRQAAAGRLPLRVHASIRSAQLDAAIELGLHSGDGIAPEVDEPPAQRLAARYTMGWLKLFADGALGSRSAALLEPYADRETRPPTGGERGMFLASADELAADLGRAAQAGISGQVHAIGDAAVRMVLDVLRGLPATRLMRRVEHAQLVDPADQPRFGRLGIAASVQPVHLRTDSAPARAAWGERAGHAFPLAALTAGGALIPFGTDAPVEPSDPWPGIAVSVARRDPFDPSAPPLGAGHALDLARAIRAACLDPALVAGRSDLGRLLPGYLADLLVVPSAGFTAGADPAVLAATRPMATILDGEVIYRSSRFDAA